MRWMQSVQRLTSTHTVANPYPKSGFSSVNISFSNCRNIRNCHPYSTPVISRKTINYYSRESDARAPDNSEALFRDNSSQENKCTLRTSKFTAKKGKTAPEATIHSDQNDVDAIFMAKEDMEVALDKTM